MDSGRIQQPENAKDVMKLVQSVLGPKVYAQNVTLPSFLLHFNALKVALQTFMVN